jgi:two-component system LytT family response regulator
MNPVRVLIADDEPLARERIRTLLSRFTQAIIVGEARDGNETLEMIRDLRPSLVFLDVQMPEMDGFAVLEKLDSTSAPAVIFVTAYDAFALRAFEVHAIDYLLKPFTRARFTRAMEHSLRRLGQANGSAGIEPGLLSLLESIRSERKAQGRIAIRSEQGVYFVRISEIDWLEAFGNYVKIHVGSQEHLLRDSLKCFEERLDPNRFLRVHRSAVVNLDSIERLEPWFHGEYSVFLRDGTKLTSSRTYSERLRSLIR